MGDSNRDGNDRNTGGSTQQTNPTVRLGLLGAVCAYVIYLGINLIRGYLNGEAGDVPGWLAILIGVFFIVCGAGYIIYLWKQYVRYREKEAEESAQAAIEETEDGASADTSFTEEPEDKPDLESSGDATASPGEDFSESYTLESDGSDMETTDSIENM